MRLRLIFLAAMLAAVTTVATAQAQSSRTPSVGVYNGYTLSGTTRLDDATVGFRAYPLLPQKLRDRTRNGGPVLRFGPIGSCRFNLSISARVVTRDAAESATDHVARVQPATTQYVYASGTRSSAAWRVIRVRGSANVRGIWALPVSLRTTIAFDSPAVPAWLEVRGTANEHTEECHSGGPRYIGQVLAVAFGAMSGTAFATDLPRLPLPPRP